ncbi:glycosyltransferase family 4 protein [Ideonella sp. DXS22W]|uniref:Glycosyltransferase family 4 protein n=1 Tax=Pseudaquabacterium inlustre TaxID=2984192 RepID=A0ABU9CHD1_9BURK
MSAQGPRHAAPRAMLISHKHPYPTDDGKKAVLAGFAAWLIERHGAAQVTYVVIDHPPADGVAEALPCETVWIPPPGRMAQVAHALASLAGLSGLSLQEAMTRSGRVGAALRALVAQRRPALLVLDTLRVGQYVEQGHADGPRRVLYMDDLFHLRFARLAALAAQGAGQAMAPAGTFARVLPAPARALLAWPALRNRLYRLEARKVERRELAAPHRFDTCLLINPDETTLLRARAGAAAAQVQTVRPLLVQGPTPPPRAYAGEALFVLFGSLRHPVHRASVLRFIGTEGDAVFAALPGLRLVIVGDGADTGVVEACRRRPGTELAGFVHDIAPLFARACALLVPSLAGGGLRLKALTAMHHGLPIVATAAGIEGLPLRDGEQVLLADTPASFAAPMQRLLDRDCNRRIGEAASAVFEREFGRSRVFADFDHLFGLRPPGRLPLPADPLVSPSLP